MSSKQNPRELELALGEITRVYKNLNLFDDQLEEIGKKLDLENAKGASSKALAHLDSAIRNLEIAARAVRDKYV